jgi:MFS family permease
VEGEEVYRRRWWILAVLCLSVVIVQLGNLILIVALPTIQQDLGASSSELQWMVDAYTLVFAALLFTSGSLGDRFGRKLALTTGLGFFGLASLVTAFSVNPEMLIAFRAVMGVGAALILPATLAIINNVFPPQKRGKAIGIWAGMLGISIPLGLYGVISGSDEGWIDPSVLLAIGGGLLILALFVGWELWTEHPMVPMRFFRIPAFSGAAATMLLLAFSMFGVAFMLTLYLQNVLGYGPLAAGLRLVPMFTVAIGAPLGASLTRRIGRKVTVPMGLFIANFGLFALSPSPARRGSCGPWRSWGWVWGWRCLRR